MVAPSREARELSARYRRRPRRAATFAIRPSPCGLGAQARAAQPQVADGWRVAVAGAGRARSAQGNRAERGGKPCRVARRSCCLQEAGPPLLPARSEEPTSELQSLMPNSYAVFCLKKKNQSKLRH